MRACACIASPICAIMLGKLERGVTFFFGLTGRDSFGERERERVALSLGETDLCENLEAVETELRSWELRSAFPLALVVEGC